MARTKLTNVCILLLLAAALAAAAFGQQPQAASGYAPAIALDTNGHASGLTLSLGPSTTFCNGSLVSYGGGVLAMSSSTTNYVYLNTAAGCSPAVKTAALTIADIPIAIVVTSSSAITSIQDVRTIFVAPNSATAQKLAAAGSVTLGAFSISKSGNVLAAPAAGQAYHLHYYLWQAAGGSGGTCATSATVTMAVTWADPSGTAQTWTGTALSLPPALAAGARQSGPSSLPDIVTASGTPVAYSATYVNGNCTTQPTAQAQIWIEAAN